MSWISKALRKVGVKKKVAKRAEKWIKNPARALQRSHKFGKLGHSVLPSSKSNNYLTKAWNDLQKSLTRQAERAVAKSSSASSAASYSSGLASRPYNILSNRVDYGYRRLADLIADEQYRGK